MYVVKYAPTKHMIDRNIKFHKMLEKYRYMYRVSNSKTYSKPTLLSYNIHYFRDVFNKYTYSKILNFIQDVEPDTVCLQEAYLATNLVENIYLPCKDTFFRNLNSLGYKNILWDRLTGVLTATKLRVICSKIIKFEDKSKSCLYTQLDDNGSLLNVYNLHLDVKSETERYKQIKNVFNNLSYPCVLTGDFNSLTKSDYTDEQYMSMLETRRQYIPEKLLVTDFISKKLIDVGTPVPTSFYDVRVDYVYVSDSLKHSTCNVVDNIKLSDHYPLIFNKKIL